MSRGELLTDAKHEEGNDVVHGSVRQTESGAEPVCHQNSQTNGGATHNSQESLGNERSELRTLWSLDICLNTRHCISRTGN